jgi:3-hydroxyacyl-CoA dehydrogenase
LSGTVTVQRHGPIAVLAIANPPVNALAQPVRAGLLRAVEELDADPAVAAIVVHGIGRHFVAGADITEFDAPPQAPVLRDVLQRIEACGKPVVAALHGAVLGGGAELALACHWRAATADLSLGFPEVMLGLLPGAGGTARLPRLVGTAAALELMMTGKPISLPAALELGLVDRALQSDALAETLGWARELVAASAPLRRTGDLPLAIGVEDEVLLRRHAADAEAQSVRAPAKRAIVECVQAAALPLPAAMAVAAQRFEACRVSPVSRALRHLFFAEREHPDASGAREVSTIGVVGAGTMGAGIAISALQAGYACVLCDTQPAALEAAQARVGKALESAERRGRLSAAQREAAVGRLVLSTELARCSSAQLVIEAAFEDLEVKRALFVALAQASAPGAVLATNTSTLDIDAIAAAAPERAADVIGMHFFSPAHVMKLVEVVPGRASSATALATAAAVARRLGKLAVRAGNDFGFVGNRMLYAYGREKELMLLEGASPEAIDSALERFGMAMGPNAVGDLTGLDVGWRARKAWAGRPADPRYYRVSDLLAESGRLGQKTGRGFYRYVGAERRREPDPEVLPLIAAEARRLGVRRRDHAPEEIVDRCVLALVEEGARLIERGIAGSAAAIDVIWCNGYGFPRHLGGPMWYAAERGLAGIVARLEELATARGEPDAAPSARLRRLAVSGERFDSLATVLDSMRH